MIELEVPLSERSYPVFVGNGVRDVLPTLIPRTAARAAIVTQDGIGVDVEPGLPSKVFTIPDGEDHKNLDTVEQLCRDWATWGLTRGDVVVSVGGGLTTDLAGFSASMFHRGIPIIHVATTLLAQIDAAIGGKTGVNLPEGKNLIGAFWQPIAVICDTSTLSTLPPREYRNGLGEMAKYAFLGVDDLAGLSIEESVAACVSCKAEVVASDEREGGRRAILNYGHTLAHALETATHYDLHHGEAVAIGVVYAAEVARRLGRISEARVDEHRAIVGKYDLSATLPTGLDDRELVRLFSRDKKAIDGITFVLDGPNGVQQVRVDDGDLLLDALEAIK